jgi:hypothetical protein
MNSTGRELLKEANSERILTHSKADPGCSRPYHTMKSTSGALILVMTFSFDAGATVCTACAAGSYYGATGMSAYAERAMSRKQHNYHLDAWLDDREHNMMPQAQPLQNSSLDMQFPFCSERVYAVQSFLRSLHRIQHHMIPDFVYRGVIRASVSMTSF